MTSVTGAARGIPQLGPAAGARLVARVTPVPLVLFVVPVVALRALVAAPFTTSLDVFADPVALLAIEFAVSVRVEALEQLGQARLVSIALAPRAPLSAVTPVVATFAAFVAAFSAPATLPAIASLARPATELVHLLSLVTVEPAVPVGVEALQQFLVGRSTGALPALLTFANALLGLAAVLTRVLRVAAFTLGAFRSRQAPITRVIAVALLRACHRCR